MNTAPGPIPSPPALPAAAAATACRPPSALLLWNNPLFRRFCRSRLRLRGLSVPLIVVLVIASFVTIFLPLLGLQIYEQRVTVQEQYRKQFQEWEQQNPGKDPPPYLKHAAEMKLIPPSIATLHRPPLLVLLALQAALLFLSGTGQVAAGMTAEADEGSVDYVRLTPMTPLAKALGYLFGLPVREYFLFAATLPFTAWCLWKGEVGPDIWLPVYGVFLLTCLLYHLTGLVSGTVLRSKRWAFLLSMALVFLLYTVAPWGASMGLPFLPFLRYVTLWGVLEHHVARLYPEFSTRLSMTGGASGGVPFFGITFSETAFTVIVQGSFVIAMLVMVWRKWKRAESHLLGKNWALGIFVWMNLLLLGNALPLAQSGDLFSLSSSAGKRGLLQQLFMVSPSGRPQWGEAVIISGVQAALLMGALFLLAIMITPSGDTQQRGLRRAFRAGQGGAPPGSDEASGLPLMMLLIVLAITGWFAFHLGLAATSWFANAHRGSSSLALLCTTLVIGLTVLVFQTMLEEGGGRGPFLATIFLGIVPLLASAVLAAAGLSAHAVYCTASVSPFTQLAYAASRLVDLVVLPKGLNVTADTCFIVWTALMSLVLLRKLSDLRRSWERRRKLARVKLPPEITDSVPIAVVQQ